ncbi:MAG: saccharopine dehydrogenase NADP-binding domain-containing protein, partial [Pseudomonadota bacterium]
MKDILLVGAGRIGAMITQMLSSSGDYTVTVSDLSKDALKRMPKHDAVKTLQLDIQDTKAFDKALKGKYAVISALPYDLTRLVAAGAVRNKVNYFDLTEDVATTKFVKEIAEGADSALMPQCGLAPGYISIAAYDLVKKFDTVTDIQMRVGALSEYPTNALKYNLTWSTEGLINEYIESCEAIVDGEVRQLAPLDGLEQFSIDGTNYECFN